MGNHCEYGFNQQQEQQLRLQDAADECGHRLGNWKWDGRNCVEISLLDARKEDCQRKVYAGEEVEWDGRRCVRLEH
jgi:hypothetical protein